MKKNAASGMESVKTIELEKTKPSAGLRPIGHCHNEVCRKNSQPIWCCAESPIINQSRLRGLRMAPPVNATNAIEPNNTDCAARLNVSLLNIVARRMRVIILRCNHHKAVEVVDRSTFDFGRSIQSQQNRRKGIWWIVGKYIQRVWREFIIFNLQLQLFLKTRNLGI